MRDLLPGARIAFAAVAAAVLLLVAGQPAAAQARAKTARTAGGKPDLNGLWQAIGTAHWDLEGHAARPGPVVALGAAGAVPAGWA